MNSKRLADGDGGRTRRNFLGRLAMLGAVGALAGCGGTASSSPAQTADGPVDSPSTPTATPPADGSENSTPTPSATGDETSSFDCDTIPSSLVPFEADDAEFTFGWDGPSPTAYTVSMGEDAVQRVATFYFAREGTASMTNWDFYIEATESVGTYGDVSNISPNATEVFRLDYGDTSVPVRHQAITDDQDIWVLGLPEDDAYRFVTVSSSVMPDQFGCHDTVRGIAKGVVESIHPR